MAENGTPHILSQRIAASADRLLPKEHDELGGFEGNLETLTVHGRTQFAIWDVVTGVRIECNIEPSEIATAQENFNKRVYVSGKIRYGRDGRPKSIAVDGVKDLRAKEDLPQARDLENTSDTPKWKRVPALG